MYQISWNEGSLNKFYSKMNNLIKSLENSVREATEQSCKNVQQLALNNKRGTKDETMIPYEVEQLSKGVFQGRIHTDKNKFPYASFLEYGTGTLAEREHIGTTKTFIKSGYRYWYLPVEKVGNKLNNTVISIDGTLFYVMHPTQPFPFMRPAGFQSRENTIKIMKDKLRDSLKGAIK